jgi:hypothetical protein
VRTAGTHVSRRSESWDDRCDFRQRAFLFGHRLMGTAREVGSFARFDEIRAMRASLLTSNRGPRLGRRTAAHSAMPPAGPARSLVGFDLGPKGSERPLRVVAEPNRDVVFIGDCERVVQRREARARTVQVIGPKTTAVNLDEGRRARRAVPIASTGCVR